MASYLLNLSDDQLNSVRSISEGTGIPMSKLFRQAVAQFLVSGQLQCSIVASGVVASGCTLIMFAGDMR